MKSLNYFSIFTKQIIINKLNQLIKIFQILLKFVSRNCTKIEFQLNSKTMLSKSETLNSLFSDNRVIRTFETHNLSSEPLLLDDESITLSLHSHLWEFPSLNWYLKAIGFIWYDENDSFYVKCFITIWFCLCRFILVSGCILDIIAMIFYDTDGYKSKRLVTINIIVTCTLVLQVLSLLPSTINIKSRLNGKFKLVEAQQLVKFLPTTYIFFILSSITGIIPAAYTAATPVVGQNGVYLLIMIPILQQIFVSGFLSAALLFISMDTRISCNLIKDLIHESQTKQLTLERFAFVREEIINRCKKTEYLNAFIVIIAVLNVISINLLLYSSASIKIYSLLANLAVLYLVKEFFYLLVIFHEIAKVNVLADELTVSLGTQPWDLFDKDIENRRITIFISAIAKPISFLLMKYRYKRIHIFLQIFGLIVPTIVSIVVAFVKTG